MANPSGSHCLVTVGNIARLLRLPENGEKGRVDYSFTKSGEEERPIGGFNAVLVASGQGVVFGTIDDCALVWDTKKQSIVYGLQHTASK